jgi:hypothetical protein
MLVYQRVTPHFYVSAKSHLKAMKPAKVKWLSTSSRGLLPKSEVSTAAVCSAKEQHTSLNKSKFPHIDNHEMYIRHVASLYLYILHTQSCSEWHPIICMCIIYIYIYLKKTTSPDYEPLMLPVCLFSPPGQSRTIVTGGSKIQSTTWCTPSPRSDRC